MAKQLVTDQLWAWAAPRPSAAPLHPKEAAPRARAVWTGRLFVRKTGIPWEDWPLEMRVVEIRSATVWRGERCDEPIEHVVTARPAYAPDRHCALRVFGIGRLCD